MLSPLLVSSIASCQPPVEFRILSQNIRGGVVEGRIRLIEEFFHAALEILLGRQPDLVREGLEAELLFLSQGDTDDSHAGLRWDEIARGR